MNITLPKLFCIILLLFTFSFQQKVGARHLPHNIGLGEYKQFEVLLQPAEAGKLFSSEETVNISKVSKDILELVTGEKDPRAELDTRNFSFIQDLNEKKYQLKLELFDKSSISLKILDVNLLELFKEKVEDFDGNYDKFISLQEKETYYIAIHQRGDWFVRRINMD